MCGIFKALKPSAPDLPALPDTPTKAEAAAEAREKLAKVNKAIANRGKQSTILAGGDIAQEKLKKTLGE